jgi:hypothetical protein
MLSKRSLIGLSTAFTGLLLGASTVLAADVTTSYTITGPTGQSYGTLSITAPTDTGYGNFPGAPACPTNGLTETISISGITSAEQVLGQIFAEYVVPVTTSNPAGRVAVPGAYVSVNQVGGNTFTATLKIPSSNVWLSSEIHITEQLLVGDAVGGFQLTSQPFPLGSGFDLFSSGCVTPPTTQLGHGSTATIGFWHNKNGQALILSLNGSSTSTSLGNWLGTNFPGLYGCLSGQTNAQIAKLFLTDFSVKGTKVDAQVLAAALAVYSTDSSLAGGTQASQYGFTVNSTGTGSKLFNVAKYGDAVGAPNNSSLTVLQILAGASAQSSNCILDNNNIGLLGDTNSLFDAINQGGDIG